MPFTTPHTTPHITTNRDLVLDWFTARRQMDGLPDNPRAAKQLAATARRALAADARQPLLPADMLPTPRQQPKQQQQAAQPAEELVQAASTPAQQQQQQQARVQAMTARELAALHSGLPSPRKQKGENLKQELGFKSGESAWVARRTKTDFRQQPGAGKCVCVHVCVEKDPSLTYIVTAATVLLLSGRRSGGQQTTGDCRRHFCGKGRARGLAQGVAQEALHRRPASSAAGL